MDVMLAECYSNSNRKHALYCMAFAMRDRINVTKAMVGQLQHPNFIDAQQRNIDDTVPERTNLW